MRKRSLASAYVLAGKALQGTSEAGGNWPRECITGALQITWNPGENQMIFGSSLSHSRLFFTAAAIVAVLLFSTVAQATAQQEPLEVDAFRTHKVAALATAPENAADSSNVSTVANETSARQSQRILGIFPNYRAFRADTQLPPLPLRKRFWFATKGSFDYGASTLNFSEIIGNGAAGPATPRSTPGQTPEEQLQRVTLQDGVFIDLSRDWFQRDPKEMPPTPPLARFAPPVTFLEFTELENPRTHSALRIGTTNNVFLGQDEVSLDTQMLQMHDVGGSANSLLDYLFYFFFPPPRDCLDGGSQAVHIVRVKVDQNQDVGAPNLSAQTGCRHAPTVADFYSSQLSSGVDFQVTNAVQTVGGIYPQFYFPPMEKLESNGLTFYVFEAQGQTQFDQRTLDYFNLPDDFRGTQTDYFWAVGAPSPFPFYLDVQRKNVKLVQVAYAGVGFGPNERGYFMGLLRQIHLP
jgi:hypothetical protein